MHMMGKIGFASIFLTAVHFASVDCYSGCPLITCPLETTNCPYSRYPSYFADIRARDRGICKGCDVCIKPGTPEDSEGCPLLPCPEKLAPGSCYKPRNYNSWVQYNGRRCPTCEAKICDAGFNRV